MSSRYHTVLRKLYTKLSSAYRIPEHHYSICRHHWTPVGNAAAHDTNTQTAQRLAPPTRTNHATASATYAQVHGKAQAHLCTHTLTGDTEPVPGVHDSPFPEEDEEWTVEVG